MILFAPSSWRILLLAGAILPGLALASSAADATELLFYSSVPSNLTDSLVHDFEASNPGITVKTFQAGTETLLQKMELEIEGTGHPAPDIMWVQERSAMERYAAAGLLAKYAPQGSQTIGAAYKDKDGFWVANFVSYVVLMYNKIAFAGQQLPTSWRDLANPKFKNKTMFADPRVSGTGAVVVAALAQNFGWNFMQAAAENRPQIANGHPAMVSTVIAGERTLSPMQDVSLIGALAHHQPVGFVFPSEGAVGVPAFVAITASTKQMEAAKKFTDYMMSLQAATLLFKNGMYDTRTDAQPPAGWPEIRNIKLLPFDWASYKTDKTNIINRFSDMTEH